VSLSDTRIIQLLNRHFIPVYLSNEDYEATGTAPPAEKAELQRIHREGPAAGLSVGTVHVYLLAPDGRLIDSMHTAQAAQPDRLIGLLERTVRKLGTAAGDPVVKPAPPSPPHAQPDELRLHLTARYLDRQGDTLTLAGQDQSAGGNWNALPSEDWILLPRARWTALPPCCRRNLYGPASPGRSNGIWHPSCSPTSTHPLKTGTSRCTGSITSR
jgi:hypothetical protein